MKGLPARGPSIPSYRGTVAHEVLELCLKDKKRKTTPFDFVGKEYAIEGLKPIEFTDEMAEDVWGTCEYVWRVLDESPGAKYSVEVRTHTGHALDPELAELVWGTADVLVYVPSRRLLVVIDFKSGYHFVEVEDNYQLILYTIGAIPLVEAKGLVVDKVMPVIIQPRAGGVKEGAVLDRKMVEEWRVFFRKAAKATQKPNAPLTAGEEQCKHCPVAGRCPEAQEMTMALARKEDWPDIVEFIDEEKFRLILEKANFIRTLLEAAEKLAVQRLMDGDKLPGFKLVASRKNRKWIDEEKVYAWFQEHGVDGDELENRKLLTPAQAERLCKEKRIEPEEIEELWETPQGEPVLAREADRRPALDSATLGVVRTQLKS